jgi:hypothetical protein
VDCDTDQYRHIVVEKVEAALKAAVEISGEHEHAKVRIGFNFTGKAVLLNLALIFDIAPKKKR